MKSLPEFLHFGLKDRTQIMPTKTLTVGHLDDANRVVQMALDHFNIPSKESNEFQLWVLFKDGAGAYPLIGHEFPFSIQMNQHREFSIIDDVDTTQEVLPESSQTAPSSIQVEPVSNEGQLQFFLKRSRKLHSKGSSKRWIRNPMSWKTNKKIPGSKPSPYDIVISTGKVFGLPLDQLTSDDELVPSGINDLLIRLFRYGPSTSGVFRKTPNQREVKEMKEIIDDEKELSLEGTSVHVVAGLMKEFLRKLPDAVCCSEYYEEFLSTNDIDEEAERIQEIKRLLDKLPVCNQHLIKRFLCVLYHIAQNADKNNMTSFNLGVCVAPSMLWPPLTEKAETAEQAKSTAPQFIEFMIERFPEIFGDESVSILGDKSEIVVDQSEIVGDKSEIVDDIPTILEDGELFEENNGEVSHNGIEHSSLNDSNTESDRSQEDGGPLLSIRGDKPLSRSTPSSPAERRKILDKNVAAETSRKIHAAFYHPKFSPRSAKRRLESTHDVTTSNGALSSTPPDNEPTTTTQLRKKKPVILTTTTSSAELIEHIPNLSDDLEKRRSASFNGAIYNQEQSEASKRNAGKRDGPSFASSQSFYTAPAHIAERVYCIDRRRQPAAPSYREHMQRHRGNQQPTLRLPVPVFVPVEDTPVGNKSHKTQLGLTLPVAQMGVVEAHLSPSHVSPMGSDRSARGSKRSTGSETSISSLSSNEEYLVVDDTVTSEEKPDVTQLKHIQDLLEVSGYAHPLRMSDETKDLISKTEGKWREENTSQDDCAEMDDFQRMTMAEETYV